MVYSQIHKDASEVRFLSSDSDILKTLSSSQYMLNSSSKSQPITLQTLVTQYLEQISASTVGEHLDYEIIGSKTRNVGLSNLA